MGLFLAAPAASAGGPAQLARGRAGAEATRRRNGGPVARLFEQRIRREMVPYRLLDRYDRLLTRTTPQGQKVRGQVARQILASLGREEHAIERFWMARRLVDTADPALDAETKSQAREGMTRSFILSLKQSVADIRSGRNPPAYASDRREDLASLRSFAKTELEWTPALRDQVKAAQKEALRLADSEEAQAYIARGAKRPGE